MPFLSAIPVLSHLLVVDHPVNLARLTVTPHGVWPLESLVPVPVPLIADGG